MRKLFIVISLIALTVNFVQAVIVNLTEEEVQEAIDWGTKNKDSYEKTTSPYKFGETEAYKENGYIGTKFFMLAFLAYQSARRYESLDRAHIEEVLNFKTLAINIVTYGYEIDFAKNYHMILKQGEKVIQPVSVEAPELVDMAPRWIESAPYSAQVTGFFPYAKIDPKAKTTIILIKARGESRFEVDFSRYK